jgi:hypothetical protein
VSDAEIAAHIATKGVTRLPPRGSKGTPVEAANARRMAHIDPAGRLRIMLDCLPAQAKRAAGMACSIATYKNPPTEAAPRRYVRKGYPFMAWIADDGVIWVRQEIEATERELASEESPR